MSRIILFFAIFTATLTGCAAGNNTPPDVRVEGAWSRPTLFADQADSAEASQLPTGTGVIYLTLTNVGGTADAFLSAETSVASSTMLHETRVENDMASMHEHGAGGVPIPAGGTVAFEPNGSHIMLMGLKQHLIEGQTFEVTLTFKSGKVVTVPVSIENRYIENKATT